MSIARESSFTLTYDFNAVPTIRDFFLSKKRIKAIMGPLGSGKSSGCVMSLLNIAKEQAPDAFGHRRTRFVIVRNTYKELYDTTKKTIDNWIHFINPIWKEAKMTYHLHFALPDGTEVHSEWLLRALDRPDHLKHLLSLEVSGAWINEAREISKHIFDMIDGRIGRFPPRRTCTYPVILLDTNPPDIESWMYNYFEELPNSDPQLKNKIQIWKQPSGLSEMAENIANLEVNYYQNLALGKDADFIRVYIHGEYGYSREGKPVFPNFSADMHVAKELLKPLKNITLVIGMDFGLFPAAVITQITPKGQLYVYDELVSEDAIDLEEFIKTFLLPVINTDYQYHNFYVIGDPAGKNRSQLDSRTCFGILKSMGIQSYPAYTNNLQDRLRTVNQYLTRMVEGKPSLKINYTCKTLIKGLLGRYHFRRLRISGERYTDIPDKNEYSHVCDALQYACLGYAPSQRNLTAGEFSERQNTTPPRLMSI